MFAKPKPKDKSVEKVDPRKFLPWVEKYRPKSVDEISHQEEVVSTLKKSLESKNLPHLLFYGPPGTGKTSTILAIARQLYGPELYKSRVMELNASDERGINVIKTKVKDFAQVATAAATHGGQPVPPYKLIILDEADSMTPWAQTALRRTMETFSRTTRFCLICNYVSRIIDPLASRCAKFRFKPLPAESTFDRLRFICESENIPYSDELATALAKVSEGDLRKAITFLQSAASLYAKDMTADSIVEMAGLVPRPVVEALWRVSASNDFAALQSAVTDVMASGYPAAQIFSQLFDIAVQAPGVNDTQKSNICEELATADQCLQEGADEFLQLMRVLSFIMRQLCSSG